MAKETPDLSGIFGNLLSNPGALSALSGILGNLGGTGNREPTTREEETKTADAPVVEKMPPLPPVESFGMRGGRHHDRDGLIGALRPYLSPKRAQALEGACKLLEVIELFRTERRGEP